MRRRRSTLLGGARGRVVEIGAGTGLNIAHYPDGIAELVLIEPEPAMRRRLARRLQRLARIVDAPAERLPLADASVDTVVSTLVLCTVNDPNTRSARSPACSARMGSCCSSNTYARARGSSRRARTTCSNRAPVRRRLSLQLPDRRADARLRLRRRSRRRRVARHAADRPSAHGGTGDSVIWTVVNFDPNRIPEANLQKPTQQPPSRNPLPPGHQSRRPWWACPDGGQGAGRLPRLDRVDLSSPGCLAASGAGLTPSP